MRTTHSAPTRSTGRADTASRLRVAVLRLARHLRQQAEGDVTPSTLSALSTVEREGPLTLGALAAAEHVQPPTMTRIVQRLEELGFVEREVDPGDRRVVRVSASEQGREYAARARARYSAYLEQRIGELDDAEERLLVRALPLLERLVPDSAAVPADEGVEK